MMHIFIKCAKEGWQSIYSTRFASNLDGFRVGFSDMPHCRALDSWFEGCIVAVSFWQAVLVLRDVSVYPGFCCGAGKITVHDVVFLLALVGCLPVKFFLLFHLQQLFKFSINGFGWSLAVPESFPRLHYPFTNLITL